MITILSVLILVVFTFISIIRDEVLKHGHPIPAPASDMAAE
jgi:hypothetical protein